MRAYRISTQENFQANADVVGQWRWMASLSYDTCAACLSLHGELFPLSQEMDSHPNCRCVPLPVVAGAPLEKWQSGEEWLRSQPEDIQRKALGPSKFEAWKKGEISLADLRGHSHNEVWGNSFHEVGLERAKQNAKIARTEKANAKIKAIETHSAQLRSNRDEVHNLILDKDFKPKNLSPEKLEYLSALVSVAGFPTDEPQHVPGRIVGMTNLSREIIQNGDLLPASEVHYLDHVLKKREFPDGTSLEEYLEFASQVINDPDSGILISQRGSRWHLAFIRESREMMGDEGYAFVMVEYRVAIGHWMTFFQPEDGIAYLEDDLRRTNKKWLRHPIIRGSEAGSIK
jgi:hypothetical protein